MSAAQMEVEEGGGEVGEPPSLRSFTLPLDSNKIPLKTSLSPALHKSVQQAFSRLTPPDGEHATQSFRYESLKHGIAVADSLVGTGRSASERYLRASVDTPRQPVEPKLAHASHRIDAEVGAASWTLPPLPPASAAKLGVPIGTRGVLGTLPSVLRTSMATTITSFACRSSNSMWPSPSCVSWRRWRAAARTAARATAQMLRGSCVAYHMRRLYNSKTFRRP